MEKRRKTSARIPSKKKIKRAGTLFVLRSGQGRIGLACRNTFNFKCAPKRNSEKKNRRIADEQNPHRIGSSAFFELSILNPESFLIRTSNRFQKQSNKQFQTRLIDHPINKLLNSLHTSS